MRIKEKNNNKLRKYCYDLSIKELILWYDYGVIGKILMFIDVTLIRMSF